MLSNTWKSLAFTSLVCLATTACVAGVGDVPPPRPTVTLTATPSSISTGQSVTLSWSAKHADSCATPEGDAMPTSGSVTLVPYEPGTYVFTLTCSGPGGRKTKTVEVEVTGSPSHPGTPFVSLSANPTVVAVGDSTTLTWSTDLGQSCTASGAWSGTRTPSGSESVTVSSSGSNFFGLTCHGPDSDGFKGVYVEGLQATVTLGATPAIVGAGQAATLTWSSTHAGDCTASGHWSGVKTASGSEQVAPPVLGDHVYTLTCSGPGAAAVQSVTVSAVAPALTLKAFPEETIAGETVTLNWDARYAQDCIASGPWAGSEPVKGTKTLTLSAPGTVSYVLACSNADGVDEKTVSVTAKAVPALPPATAYQMNPRHDGSVSFAGGVQMPASTTPDWSRDLGATVSYPLIADGLVIVATRNPDGSNGGRLLALNQATGATVWGPIALSGTYWWVGLTYEKGRVFVLNFDGLVKAFNAANGAALWSRQLPGYWHDSAPTAYGGKVFATGNDGLFALDAETGDIQWTNSIAGSHSSPAVTSEGVYTMRVCTAKGVNPLTGEDLWTRNSGCSGGGGRNAAVRNGRAYVRYFTGAANSARVFDASTGADAGELATLRIPALTDSLAITLNASTLAAINRSDGTQKWTFGGDGQLVSAPIVVNDTVFMGSASGKVFAVDAATGSEKWVGTAPASIEAPDEHNIVPLTGLAAGEGLLVVPAGTHLAAWRLQTGDH